MANLIALDGGTVLADDYRIERVLGAGGFGVTYLAQEIALNRYVTIKEYFPADFAARADGRNAEPRSEHCVSDYKWGLERFIEEAQTLARFNHPNIVRVYRYFRANNTGYMVLHFEEGQSLKAWLKGLGRAPRQKELDAIVAPLLDALEVIHKADFLHRDIAPDNIIIRKDGSPVLIDFGSARGEIAAHSKTVSALVKPGYSPYEQYAETSRQQGPWTDVYALGATLYHAVAGKRPPDSPSRMVKDEIVPAREAALAAYRAGFLKAIDKALVLGIDARPQSVAQWRAELLAPDPPKQSWLSRTSGRKAAHAAEPLEQVAAAVAVAAAEPAPPPAATPKAAGPNASPQPDAPGPRGGLLDFMEGLRRKSAAAEAGPASPAPAGQPAKAKDTKAVPQAKEPKAAASEARRKSADKDVGKELVPVASPSRSKAPRPNPVSSKSPKSWRPLMWKLLIGVGVASAAVAMQDRFPHMGAKTPVAAAVGTKRSSAAAPQPEALPVAEVKAHDGGVTSLAYGGDGRVLVTVGKDGRLKVWDASSAALKRTIELGDGPATSLAVFGTRAVTGHANGNTVLWDVDKGDRIGAYKRNDAEIWAVTFLGRQDRFATASHDWKVTLWDEASSSPAHVIDGHQNAVQAAAFAMSPKGPLLATAGADRTARIWNVDNLEQTRRYTGHSDFVTTLAFAPDARAVASAGLDGGIRLWSATSRSTLRRLYGHKGRVGGLAFAPKGDVLVSAGEDGKVRVWDLKRGRAARVLPGTFVPQQAIAVSPDGSRIAAAGDDGILRIWANPLDRSLTN